jgi:hypothetical protein
MRVLRSQNGLRILGRLRNLNQEAGDGQPAVTIRQGGESLKMTRMGAAATVLCTLAFVILLGAICVFGRYCPATTAGPQPACDQSPAGSPLSGGDDEALPTLAPPQPPTAVPVDLPAEEQRITAVDARSHVICVPVEVEHVTSSN